MKIATALCAPLVAALLLCSAPALAEPALAMPVMAAPAVPVQALPSEEPPPVTAELEMAPAIAEVHANPSRLRGRVEIDWTYTGDEFAGLFVVERSTNGGAWRPVRTCTTGYDPEQDRYGCTDSRLISGTTYAYRICISAKGTSCTSVGATKPVTVKAP